GIPAYNLVRHGLHAVSGDEQRSNLTPRLSDHDDRIVQVLFTGAHADVGGAYPDSESGLSDGGLQWVVEELTKLGVAFAAKPGVVLKPDACGIAHAPWPRRRGPCYLPAIARSRRGW